MLLLSSCQCDSMVAEYTPQIIKLLLEDTDPRVVCTRLGVCTQSNSGNTLAGNVMSALIMNYCNLEGGRGKFNVKYFLH